MAIADFPYSFASQPIIDPTTGQPVLNATGGVLLDPRTNTALLMADMNGNAVTSISGNAYGMSMQFRSTQLAVLVRFGSVYVQAPAIEVFDAIQTATNAVSLATSAQSSAQSAATAAAASATAAAAAVASGGGGGGVTVHSQLSGLGADDHTQYYNVTRGDARYFTQAQVTSAISSAIATASASDRLRSNHSGTQLAATISDFTAAVYAACAAMPDGTLAQADVSGLSARLTAIETTLAAKADAANAIAAYVPAGGTIPTGLAVNSIVALEVSGGNTGVPDPALVGYAPISPTGATTFTIPLPTGSIAGDMLVLAHMHTPGGTASYSLIPSGSTGLATADISTTNRLEFTYKVLLSADITTGSVSIAYTGSQKPSAGALVVRNAGTPQGVVTAVTASSTTIAPPAVTTTKRALVFTFLGKRVTGATFSGSTAPTNEALAGSDVSTGTATGGETALIAAQYPAVQAAGTITPTAWTLNAAAANFFTATIAIPATA